MNKVLPYTLYMYMYIVYLSIKSHHRVQYLLSSVVVHNVHVLSYTQYRFQSSLE